ncbi:MAG: hypothetical protein HYY13_01115 [Nitrospirae bacterium]|nr:hypothetical protein [Nitrospirota bacterium]
MIGNRSYVKNAAAAMLVACLMMAGSCGKEEETTGGGGGGGGSVSSDTVKDSGKIASEVSKMPSATVSKDNATDAADSMASDMSEGASFNEMTKSTDPQLVATDLSEGMQDMGSMGAPSRAASAAARMIGRSAPRLQAASTCPVITNTSSGSTVNVSIAGNGCKTPKGATMTGTITLDGTADKATGNVDASVVIKDFNVSGALPQGGTIQLKMAGNGKFVGTGLKEGTSSFTAQNDFVGSLSMSASGTGMSLSADCSIEQHDQASGSSSKVSFTVKRGMLCSGVFGGTTVTTATGEAVQNADGTATVNATGEFGTSQATGAGGSASGGASAAAASGEFSGKVTVELKNVVFDTTTCGEDHPAKSGTIVFKGKNTATLTVKGCGSYEVALQ